MAGRQRCPGQPRAAFDPSPRLANYVIVALPLGLVLAETLPPPRYGFTQKGNSGLLEREQEQHRCVHWFEFAFGMVFVSKEPRVCYSVMSLF
jgi:hypothetical protein